MATYVFKAMDLTGAKATGEVEAETKQVVSDQLKSRGLIDLDISDKHTSRQINLELFNKLSATDLAVMTRQLATMVQSGMTILRALYVLEAQTENKILNEAIVGVRKDVEAGLPLSDALERHPKIFDPLFVSMTRAGETGGMLDESLIRVADQLEKADSLRRQVKSAMTYPIVVLTFAGGILLALVSHPLGARLRGRTAASGPRHHRQDRRQRRRRAGDEGRHRERQGRRHHRRPAQGLSGVPDDGDPHGGRRRGDRLARHDALQDRGLLRGSGRRGGQVAHVNPRADHDHRGRRHRRVHRHLDVPAAVQGLRRDPVSASAAV